MALEAELATYARVLPQLLAAGKAGGFVVIHGAEVVGDYPTLNDALRAGWERWLFEPFLVREVAAVERVLRMGGARFNRQS